MTGEQPRLSHRLLVGAVLCAISALLLAMPLYAAAL
jgi:hypothetical protein